MKNEGYIKFKCNWINSINQRKGKIEWLEEGKIKPELVKDIIEARTILYGMKLIGIDEDGISYGNISKRLDVNLIGKPRFIITGTQTSGKSKITWKDFSIVSDFDIEKNYIECYGLSKPSSESLTHGILYLLDEKINSVIHLHSPILWDKFINEELTTNKNAECGSIDMANEIRRLYETKNFKNSNIIVMGGHRNGIIVIGENVKSALNFIIDKLTKSTSIYFSEQ